MAATLHTAEILYAPGTSLPIGRDRGLLLDEEGVILAIGSNADLARDADRRVDHPLITPGFVNAHVHLTDAVLTERVPGGEGLVPWVESLLARRGTMEEERVVAGATATLQEMWEAGTVAVGEVVNDLRTVPAMLQSEISCRLIFELLAADPAGADDAMRRFRTALSEVEEKLPISPAAHAPYSVSPELTSALVQEARDRNVPFFIHLAEDPAERALYMGVGGPWVDFLAGLGIPSDHFARLRRSPIDEYDRAGLIGPGFTAVHLADATDREIDLLAGRGASAILSPGSNLHIGKRLPPYRRILVSGLRFALGTDGRGSAPSMDVLDEARTLCDAFPEERPGRLLRSLTIDGAAILGMPEVTTLAVGGRIGLLAHTRGASDATEDAIASALLDRANRIARIV